MAKTEQEYTRETNQLKTKMRIIYLAKISNLEKKNNKTVILAVVINLITVIIVSIVIYFVTKKIFDRQVGEYTRSAIASASVYKDTINKAYEDLRKCYDKCPGIGKE